MREVPYEEIMTKLPMGCMFCRVLLDSERKARDFVIEKVNDVFEHLTGLARDKVEGATIRELFPTSEDKVEGFLKLYNDNIRSGKKGNYIFEYSQTRRCFHVLASLIEGDEFVCVFSDITDLRHATNALKESEEKYKAILENTHDAIYVYRKGKFIFVNKQAVELTKRKEEDLLSMHFLELIHPEDREKVKEYAEKREKGEGNFPSYEARVICGDGTIKLIETHPRAIVLNGEYAVLGAVFDITESRKQEEALKKSEKRYKEIYENIQDIYFETSMSGTIYEFSPVCEKLLGYKRKEMIGINILTYYHDPVERTDFVRCLLEKEKLEDFEIVLKHKNGKQVIFSINAKLIKEDAGEEGLRICGTLRDITQRKKEVEDFKRMQAQLHHSDRLASIGIMATGVAHEINNPLAIIKGNIERIMSRTDNKEIQSILEKQDIAVSRMEKIVTGLNSYSRSVVEKIEQVNIHAAIRETVYLLDEIFKRDNIELQLELQSKTPLVRTDKGKIQQIVMNMLTNARDAFEDKRKDMKILIQTRDDGDKINLMISDTGCGIEDKNLELIFDPFFTTKPSGKGTGLGLAICKNLVESMNGEIKIKSEIGQGTTFCIKLPQSNSL